ncbi:MAG: hypothetical protein EA378_06155 [Phycisphaerales bacterium]|nr:MAG: hypothetical protein EA378_06155 [Phycisphaerales bacterium]
MRTFWKAWLAAGLCWSVTGPSGWSASAGEPGAIPRAESRPIAEMIDGEYIQRQADGSLLVAERWTIKGEGTPEKPFEIDWRMLTAAADEFSPQLGKTRLPRWTRLIHGRHVKLAGYIAFPFMANESDEVLLMLNEWDGCCLGVPPSAYDAIEVELKEVVRVTGGHSQFNRGTITGIFKAEPYVMDQWLLGLWVIDRAEVETDIARRR